MQIGTVSLSADQRPALIAGATGKDSAMSAGTVLNPIAGRGVIASFEVAQLTRDRLAAAAGTCQHPARGDTS